MEKPVEILLVEDNPADVDLTRESLGDAKILNSLHVTPNGLEALAFLRAFEDFWPKTAKPPSGRSGSPPSSAPNPKAMT